MLHRKRKSLSLQILALVIVFIWLFPLILVIVWSLKPEHLFGRKEMTWIFQPTWEHYRLVLTEYAYVPLLINSILVSLGATLLAMSVGVLAGYSLMRFKTGGNKLPMWFLSGRMIPTAAVLMPMFMMFNRLDLLDTRFVLVITYMVFNIPFVVWMSRSFFSDIPEEIEDSALIDGCSRFQALVRVILPITRTGLIATAVFSFVLSWNEYLLATVMTNSQAARTLPTSVGEFLTNYQINWGPMFAESVLIILPILIATMLLQRYLVRGMTMGAIK